MMNIAFRKMMMGLLIAGLCTGLAYHPAGAAQSAACTWTGSLNKSWMTAGNWSCGHVPTGADDAVIANVGANNPLISTYIDTQVRTLTIDSGGILEANGSGNLNLVIQGSLVDNNGTIKTTGTLDSASICFYTPRFTNDGVIDINAGTLNVYTTIGGTQTGSFSGRYGSINLHGTSGALFTFNSSSVINVNHIFFDYITTVDIYATVALNWPNSDFAIYYSTVNLYFVQNFQIGSLSNTGGALNLYWLGAPITGNLLVPAGASLIGAGSIAGNLVNAGTLKPGTSPGVIAVGGSYTQESTGTLAIEIGGASPGTGHDQLAVGGAALLDGTLEVSLVNAFAPALGQAFTILTCASRTGAFSAMNLADPGPGLGWDIHYGPTSITLTVAMKHKLFLPFVGR